jgi:serine/threonine protein kinase
MEYASGGDVSSLLEFSGRFSQIIAKNVAVHLLLALKDLKALQIVHGDVKLENIMYCPDSGIIKLGDFGLSFPSTSDGNVSKSALGTPEYMAPEQIKYSKKGYFSDMWSVGICIYEMIFGIPPFYGESAEQIMHKIADSLDRSTNYLYFENSVKISSQCKDLICGLLDPNYLTRLTLEQAMKHEFFDFVDWNAPVSIYLPEVKDPFMERNKRFNSLQFYNMQTIGTEVVSFQDGIFNQQTSLKNQLLLLKLFPIKNLNKIQK